MHQRFFDGLVTQVKDQQSNHVFPRNVQEYMDMR
jgi:hypothetical protein